MKQKLLQSLMLIAALLTSAHAFAYDFEEKNSDGVTIYYNITSSYVKTCEVTYRGSYSNSYSYSDEYTGSITIPETVTYNGTTYSVIRIGRDAFYKCTGLTSITIPNSVTSIGYSAFEYCTSLTNVIFNAEDCETMGSLFYPVFKNCTKLSSVTIGENVKNIPSYAFCDCTGLTSISIPNSVTSIGQAAFEGTGWYNNQPDSILYLANYCLGYKRNKPTGNLTIKEGTRLIAPSAFCGCSGLTSITIPNSVTSIGDKAFESCSGLTSITIPNSVTSIGDYAFFGCI